jgi:hypothetical protein
MEAGEARPSGPAATDEYLLREDDPETTDRSVVEKGWFLALVGGLAALMTAFIVLPYLIDSRSPTGPGTLRSPMTPGTLSATPPSRGPKSAGPAAAPALPAAAPRPEAIALAAHGPSPAPPAALARPTDVAGKKKTASAPAKGAFWVQVGTFRDSKDATRLAARLSADHYPAVVRPAASAPGRHVVRVGTYPDRKRAEETQAALEKQGVRGFVLREGR